MQQSYSFEYHLYDQKKWTSLNNFKEWFWNLPKRDAVIYREIGYDNNGYGRWIKELPKNVIEMLRFEVIVNNDDPEIQQEIYTAIQKGLLDNKANIVML